MARVTRADLLSQDIHEGVPLLEAVAPLATGKNEDGTDFTLPVTGALDATAVGSLSGTNQSVSLAVAQGMVTVSFVLSGTFVGTGTFECSFDGGTSWFSLAAGIASSANAASGIATTATGVWEAAIPAGATHVRLRCSAYTSGTIGARVSTSFAAYEPAVTAAVTSLPSNFGVVPRAASTGSGIQAYRSLGVAAGVLVKSTAGMLYVAHFTNLSASTRFIKLYNKATTPVVGTDTTGLTYPILAGSVLNLSLSDLGVPFSAGIGLACTQGLADNDTTLAAAGEVVGSLFYG